VTYCAVFGTGIGYMLKLVTRGPDQPLGQAEADLHRRPARPLSAAPDNTDPAIGLDRE
jgi:cytochrome d ubiquinol oxidase subunit I